MLTMVNTKVKGSKLASGKKPGYQTKPPKSVKAVVKDIKKIRPDPRRPSTSKIPARIRDALSSSHGPVSAPSKSVKNVERFVGKKKL